MIQLTESSLTWHGLSLWTGHRSENWINPSAGPWCVEVDINFCTKTASVQALTLWELRIRICHQNSKKISIWCALELQVNISYEKRMMSWTLQSQSLKSTFPIRAKLETSKQVQHKNSRGIKKRKAFVPSGEAAGSVILFCYRLFERFSTILTKREVSRDRKNTGTGRCFGKERAGFSCRSTDSGTTNIEVLPRYHECCWAEHQRTMPRKMVAY